MTDITKQPLFSSGREKCSDLPGQVAPGPLWSKPRFEQGDDTILDRLTGLVWTEDAAQSMFPMAWAEALELMERMNQMNAFGFCDWRMPSRRELFSLLSHVRVDPALSKGNLFANVNLGDYWTSTTQARLSNNAWQVDMGKGRVHTAMKHKSAMIWPVCGGQKGQIQLAWTGQKLCYSRSGQIALCEQTGQDGELRKGVPWPSPRFTQSGPTVLDLLTGLEWTANASCWQGRMDWDAAFEIISDLNEQRLGGRNNWRVPTIRELDSITDMGAHSPAVAQSHPFINVRESYWSSTTCAHNSEHAWTLDTIDGEMDIGLKKKPEHYVWAVRQ